MWLDFYKNFLTVSAMSCADYLRRMFDLQLRKETVKKAVETIKENIPLKSFDTIAVRGISGVLLGSPLAIKLNKNLCVVRKSDGSHSSNKIESGLTCQGRYLIVDDLIETGATVKAIVSGIKENDYDNKYFGDKQSRCVGIYLFRYSEFKEASSLTEYV